MKDDTTQHPATEDSDFYWPAEPFFEKSLPTGLTYDDVSLATQYSAVLPQDTCLDVALSETIKLSLPILSADMDTVTEADMAIAMALNGGMGLIHYNMPERQQVKSIARVKNHINGLIRDPITVDPEACIGEILTMVEAKNYTFSTFPVIDKQGVLLGLLPGKMVKKRYAAKQVHEAMMPVEQVLTINEKEIADDPIATADRIFDQHIGIHKLLVIDDARHLRGLFTLSDIERITEETNTQTKPALDSQFRLLCGAAVSPKRDPQGAIDSDQLLAHTTHLVEEGVDAIALSTAHGHSAGVGEAVRLLRKAFPELTLIAGNVAGAEGVAFLAEAGADVIKIGQGPGSICTTRLVAGIGVPQLTALYAAGKAAKQHGVRILAAGGIVRSGDMVKALTLADAVICGSLLAGCREAPGQIVEIDGKYYKQYRGMGSTAAMREGSAARYGHRQANLSQKVAAEGIEALKESSGSVDKVLAQLTGGIQSGMGYLGAATLTELKQKARYIRVTQAGRHEAGPHDIIEIKTALEAGKS